MKQALQWFAYQCFKAGFHMSHFIVFHRISSEFWVYEQLGLIPIYENQPNHMKTRYLNSS